MYVMMPVQVVGRACQACQRLEVIVEKDYAITANERGNRIVDLNLECRHYDECLNALDMWQRSAAEETDKK